MVDSIFIDIKDSFTHTHAHTLSRSLFPSHTRTLFWFLGLVEVLGKKYNEWVANPLGPGHTSALQIKTRFA